MGIKEYAHHDEKNKIVGKTGTQWLFNRRPSHYRVQGFWQSQSHAGLSGHYLKATDAGRLVDLVA